MVELEGIGNDRWHSSLSYSPNSGQPSWPKPFNSIDEPYNTDSVEYYVYVLAPHAARTFKHGSELLDPTYTHSASTQLRNAHVVSKALAEEVSPHLALAAVHLTNAICDLAVGGWAARVSVKSV